MIPPSQKICLVRKIFYFAQWFLLRDIDLGQTPSLRRRTCS